MTSNGHKKHADMIKPHGGKINRNELAFIGAPCGIIQKLCSEIASQSKDYTFGFIDADHSAAEDSPIYRFNYTDKIAYHQLSFHQDDMTYDFRKVFEDTTLTLVNGNHFKAEKQVVIIHEKKKDSLHRKLDRLTNVKFFILADDQEDIYNFLKEHNPEFINLPMIRISDIARIYEEVKRLIESRIPPVYGLVLAGGKSTRMGKDKAQISYYGKPHSEYIADLLNKLCDQSFISVREKDDHPYPQIQDTFTDLGPFGGILSAFRHDPNAAWLTVATDVPYLNEEVLTKLIKQRDINKIATCFHNPETGFPEPLITLWEPRAYQRMLYFLGLGYSCPRKTLINSDIKEIHLGDHNVLFNANTPEEMNEAMQNIKKVKSI